MLSLQSCIDSPLKASKLEPNAPFHDRVVNSAGNILSLLILLKLSVYSKYVAASQNGQHGISITKTNKLIPFRDMKSAYSENHKKSICTLWTRMHRSLTLKQ
jgi:hypothetical protein